jgi:hypothetical protein
LVVAAKSPFCKNWRGLAQVVAHVDRGQARAAGEGLKRDGANA